MIDQIHINDEQDGHAIMKRAGAVFNPKGDTCISRRIDGKIVGGVAYSNFTGVSCEIHVAGFQPNWMNRDLLWVAFDYPFVQLGSNKVFIRVQASNKASMKLSLHLGFSIETTLKDVYADGDMYVLSMLKEDCRHLKIKPRVITRNGSN